MSPALEEALSRPGGEGSCFPVVMECPHCADHLQYDVWTGASRVLSIGILDRPDDSPPALWAIPTSKARMDRIEELKSEAKRLLECDDFRNAAMKLEELIAIRRHDALAWYNLGVARCQLSDLPGAAVAFREAVTYSNEFGAAWWNLSRVALQLGDLQEAHRAAAGTIDANPASEAAQKARDLLHRLDPPFLRGGAPSTTATVTRRAASRFDRLLRRLGLARK